MGDEITGKPLQVVIGATTDGRFILDFGQPIQVLSMPVAEATALAQRILKAAKTLRAKKS